MPLAPISDIKNGSIAKKKRSKDANDLGSGEISSPATQIFFSQKEVCLHTDIVVRVPTTYSFGHPGTNSVFSNDFHGSGPEFFLVKLAGRVGLGQKVFETSRAGSVRVGSPATTVVVFNLTGRFGAGRIASYYCSY